MENLPEIKGVQKKLKPEVQNEKPERTGDLFEQEALIQEKIGETIDGLTPDKFHGKSGKFVRWLTALSIFIGSSSVFAKGAEAQDIEKKLKGIQNAITETLKKPDDQKPTSVLSTEKETMPATEIAEAKFDWKKLVRNIEISGGLIAEQIPPFQTGTVEKIGNYQQLKNTEPYKDLTLNKYYENTYAFFNSVYRSKNAVDFFRELDRQKDRLDGQQKTLFLQYLGDFLGDTYNLDMLEKNEHVGISEEKMFQGLKMMAEEGTKLPTGMCGNIHVFLTKAAKKLGMEAWLQSGTSESGVGHVFAGLIIPKGNKDDKQIAFIDYGKLIPTGTLNYRDALGIAERHMGRIGALDTFVGNEKEVLFPVKSRAAEVLEAAAGLTDTRRGMEKKLYEGSVAQRPEGLNISLSPEVKSIALNTRHVGLLAFKYDDSYKNPYQSLENLEALRGSFYYQNRKLDVEADATILQLGVKDLQGGIIKHPETIGRLSAGFIDSLKLSKSQYGEFLLNFGATLQIAMRLPMEGENLKNRINLMGEGGIGARLIYLDPKNIGRFYVGASEIFRGQTDDFENQNIIIKEAARSFTLGADIKIREGKILNLETAKSQFDWGQELAVKGALVGKKWKGTAEYAKTTSDFPRFIPSGQRVDIGVGYRGGPKWEIDVIGFKEQEQYADAPSRDIYGGEVKLKIFLWD